MHACNCKNIEIDRTMHDEFGFEEKKKLILRKFVETRLEQKKNDSACFLFFLCLFFL